MFILKYQEKKENQLSFSSIIQYVSHNENDDDGDDDCELKEK